MLSTTEDEKNEICRHTARFHAPRVLEIGAFKGETTRLLAEVARERDGYVVVIDPMRWAAELVSNGLERHLPRSMARVARGFERFLGAASYEPSFWATVGELRPHVHLRRARSDDPQLAASRDEILREFDVVFIDGDHSYAGAATDLREWGSRTARGGVILVHDAVPSFPGVVDALVDFERATGVTVTWPIEGSLAVLHVDRDLRAAAAELAPRSDAAE